MLISYCWLSSVFSQVNGVVGSDLFFFDFFNKNIPQTATTRQHIQITGLTANQANHIVRNHTIIVNHRAIIPVQTQIIFAKKGRTFAKVSINLNIDANQQYINNKPTNLISQVCILFSFCACKNISSALTLPWLSRLILLQFETL
jgi:hypothetical protein